MPEMTENPALLPPGFEDLLQEDARRSAFVATRMTQIFTDNGYMFVKPPLMENECSFAEVPMGKVISKKMFRLMDPESKEMLGVRADITSQIVRIALTRLPKKTRPLRICYAADSFRIEGADARSGRQFTQIGCEIFGSDEEGVEADAEVCVMAVHALRACGVGALTIDFCLPTIVSAILKELSDRMSPSDFDAVRKSIERRDVHALKQYDDVAMNRIIELIQCTGPAKDVLDRISRVINTDDESQRQQVVLLRAVTQKIEDALESLQMGNVTLSVDPVEMRGFEYHSGIAFSFYAQGAQAVLGRGGRYVAMFSGAHKGGILSENAVGFTFYTDVLRDIVNAGPEKPRVYVDVDTPWIHVEALHNAGYVTSRALDTGVSGRKFCETEAKAAGADYILCHEEERSEQGDILGRLRRL